MQLVPLDPKDNVDQVGLQELLEILETQELLDQMDQLDNQDYQANKDQWAPKEFRVKPDQQEKEVLPDLLANEGQQDLQAQQAH